MNIKDETYSFTVSQLLQFLCAYCDSCSLIYRKTRSYIMVKLLKSGQPIGLLRTLLIYDPAHCRFHLFSVPLFQSDKKLLSEMKKQRNHDAAIPVKIPENEKFLFRPDKSNTKTKYLTEYTLDMSDPIPFHPSFNETYSKVLNITTEEYEFTSSQFMQFLVVFWSEFWCSSEHLDIGCLSRDQFTRERCCAGLSATYEAVQDKFYLKRRTSHTHNHAVTGYQTPDGTNVDIRTKIEKIYGLYVYPRSTIDFFISRASVPVDIPEINGLPIESNAGIDATLSLIKKDPNLVTVPYSHDTSIHLTYAKLFFNKGLFHIFTHSQLFQFMRIYNNCFRLDTSKQGWYLVCKVKSFDGHDCDTKYYVRYLADKNVFVVYSMPKTWSFGHSHGFAASLSLVGLKLSDVNLKMLDEGDSYDKNQFIYADSKVVEVGESDSDICDPDEETICGSSDGMSESGEKQIDSGKRSGSDRHSIDNPPLVVGPKSLYGIQLT
ncbi:unnamed protein product [Ambrosiozyma monospora]|uniref:Unnamed protein product n=1 Tax=Ambrosiozyma monospora TaxID=43982 RepID=A0ACB5TCA4_AMBMO|nr:unnamed protein product [Ambrosiozyma monospora]